MANHDKRRAFVSVIMPVRNEGAYMTRSLQAVIDQDYPRDRIEIIVADGMSTDDTVAVVESFCSRHGNISLINNPGRIVPVGMNLAIEKAQGEIIVRVDGHCEIAPDYVSRCVAYLKSGAADGVGGPIDTVGETFTANVIALAMSSPFGVGGSAFRTVRDKSMLTDTVAFPAYTKGAIERAGRYDEELVRNQDDEYNYRLRKRGGRILLADDIHCRYYSRGSLRSLWRQYFQYGYWKVRVMQKHPLQMKARQFVPALFVAALAASLLATVLLPWAGLLFISAVALYVVANISASVITARSNARMLFMLPLVFAALHFSYGSGFMFGLMRFWNRWGKDDSRDQWTQPLEKARTI
jgi:glycosyltransferase involved in cell wall biosynthesis